jgi:hypothetical protein
MKTGFLLGLGLLFVSLTAGAQFQWSGAWADRSWATAGNWTNSAAPPALSSNRHLFASAGFGANNMDQDRTLFGPSDSLTNGLHYRCPSVAGLSHTTDLHGFTLKLDGGSLMVGQNSGTNSVVIANGTLQLGGSNRASLHVGYLDSSVTAVFNNSNRLTVAATLESVRIGDLTAGYLVSGNSGRVPQGILDLTGATLTGPSGANSLKVEGAIRAGQSSTFGSTTSAWSQVLFPASLTSLEAGSLLVGAGHYRVWGRMASICCLLSPPTAPSGVGCMSGSGSRPRSRAIIGGCAWRATSARPSSRLRRRAI